MPWNTIDVPLETGWQCTLMPALQYNDMMRWGHGYHDMAARRLYPDADKQPYSYNAPRLSEFEISQLWEKQRLRQLEEDQRTFARFFRPDWDLRSITGGNALDNIKTFLRDALGLAHWNMPKTNEDIQQILCEAVAQDRLIPVINYEYRGVPRVGLPDPAPQRWPATGGGSYGFAPKVISFDEFVALQRANDELADSSVGMASAGLSAVIEPLSSVGNAASSGGGNGFDWLGAAETVAGAVFGGGDDSGNDDNASEEDFTGGASDDSTPLDAQPFEYTKTPPGEFGDDTQTAWLPIDGGPPNQWVENPSGSRQMRYYDANGNAAVDFDFDHDHGFGIPHAHNWDNGVRDNGNSFSLLP